VNDELLSWRKEFPILEMWSNYRAIQSGLGLDYGAAFGKPVRILNDAAMHALSSYKGRRMPKLSRGIFDAVLTSLELAL